MKPLLRSALVVISICLLPLAWAAETKPAVPPPDAGPAAKPLVAGRYAGQWKSTTEAAGELRLTFKQDGPSWGVEASFTFEGAEIPTKMKTVDIDGAKVELVFDWEIQGTPGQSKLAGELTSDTLQGTYESKSPSGATRGTWTVKRN